MENTCKAFHSVRFHYRSGADTLTYIPRRTSRHAPSQTIAHVEWKNPLLAPRQSGPFARDLGIPINILRGLTNGIIECVP